MKKCLVPGRRTVLRACAYAIVAPWPSISLASANFLKARHEYLLAQARLSVNVAVTATERALALRRMAEELDALGRSLAALRTIDLALSVSGEAVAGRLHSTKARILFSLGHPEQALALLGPAANASPAETVVPLDRPLEPTPDSHGLQQEPLTAVFSCMQLTRWREAIDALARMPAGALGVLPAYRSVIYRYIMARANSSELIDAGLERDAAYYASSDRSGYGLVLRLWQGTDTSSEIGRFMDGVGDAKQQDMLGKILFYAGAYLRYAADNVEAGRSMLQSLNNLAPYGCIEWEYGKAVLS